MDIEKIKTFKQLYVATNNIVAEFAELGNSVPLNEQSIEQAIRNIDELIAMLPMEFPDNSLHDKGSRVLHINMKDAADEPKEKMCKKDGATWYETPENTTSLFEENVLISLENSKFLIWNKVVLLFKDPVIREKYNPLMLAQAEKCLTYFPNNIYGRDWAKTMIVMYANQIGRFALENEQDPEKLDKALPIVIKGFHHSNWYKLNDIKDTIVRLLLKLGREEDAFPIVQEGLKKNPEYADFQDLKNDAQYLAWANGVAQREADAKQQLEKAYQNFLLLVKEEQAKTKNQFVYPDHPLVKQHVKTLNLIKERMVAIRLEEMYRKSDWITADLEDEDTYKLQKWSIEEVQAFEQTNDIHLPDELKVYLMEIGTGGGGYTCYGGDIRIYDTRWDEIRKPFPITPDKIHPINHRWNIKAWVYSDSTAWKKIRVFKEEDDMKTLFGLAPGAKITDGCMEIGNSSSQDELYLIMNGPFEGEVWVDTLQYGAEVGGCFGAATAKRLKLLEYMAESLLAKYEGYTEASDQGAWM